MEIKASLNQLRMSPRKIRLVIDLVRKMPVDAALNQLKFSGKLAGAPVAKLIESAIANAENTYSLERTNLFIKEIRSDEGKMLKRWMPKAHGRATVIRKRAAHVTLILGEIHDSGQHEKKEVKVEKPIKLEDLAKEAEIKTNKKAAKKGEDKKDDSETKPTKSKSSKAAPEKGFVSKVFNRKAGER
jgi:large subunit ribosomal protein L22